MEGFYSGNLADQLAKLKRKSQLSGLNTSASDMAGITSGWASSLGANNRADLALSQAKKEAEDLSKYRTDTLSFQKENAASQLAQQKALADQQTNYNTWLAGNQLNAAQKSQPSTLDKALSYGGTAMNALALNNLASNPIGKLAEYGIDKTGNFLFNLFGGGDSIFL